MTGIRPTFFIVGAPRCGTTFLSWYLDQHPSLFLARKELHFFGRDLRFPKGRISLQEYLAEYEPAGPHQVAGEASVLYLYSRSAAAEILDFAPEARVIIMLRDPVDQVRSMHHFLRSTLNEDIPDLRDALAAQEDRWEGRRLPPGVVSPDLLQYTRIASYPDQVARYLDRFGRERVHIVLFEDLQDDPRAVGADAFRFLGVDDRFVGKVRTVNPSGWSRSLTLASMMTNPPTGLRRAARALLSPRVRQAIFRLLLRAERRAQPPPDMDPDLRAELRTRFAPEVDRLAGLISRDLSAWLPRETAPPD